MADRAADLCTSLRQEVFDKYAHGTIQIGPGSHDISFKSVRPRSPTYVFGRSDRVYNKPSQTPGPDAYQSPEKSSLLSKTFDSRFNSVPMTKFGTSDRVDEFKTESPAPGTGIHLQYDVVHSVNAVRNRSPSFSMSRGPRDGGLRLPASPGPGAYSTESGLGRQTVSVRPTSARMHFGTSARAHERGRQGPGPGSYAVDSIDGIGGRPASSHRPRSASTRIGTGQRFTLTASGGPGPAYTPSTKAVLPSSPQYSFGNDPRDERRTRSASPGPGAYQVEMVDSLGRKQASSYRPSSAITKFGSSGRFDLRGIEGPAPGQYGITPDPKFSRSARTVFGKSSRHESLSNTAPGPGAYTSTVGAVRPRSATVRFGSSSRFTGHGGGAAETPAPNAYGFGSKTPVLGRAPVTVFGKSSREEKLYAHSPGNKYEIDHSLAATRPRSGRTKIGTAARFPSLQKLNTPGPGDYGVPKKPLSSSPAFTMRPR